MLDDIGGKIKRIPPIVWLIGGIIVVAAIILTRGGSGGGSGASGVTGTPGGSGGDFSPDQGEQIVALADELHRTEADLEASLKAQAEQNKAFQDEITALMKPPTIKPPIPPVKPPSGGGNTTGTGGGTSNPIRTIIGYTLRITQSTPIYSSTGKRIGSISSGTYATKKVKVGGAWRYIITSGPRKGQYFLAEPWFHPTAIYSK